MFTEMTQDEMMKTDGGLVLTTAGMIVGAKVGKAVMTKFVAKTAAAKIAGGAAGMTLYGGAGLAADAAIGRRVARRFGW